MQLQLLEVRVAARLGRDLRDVELVADVTVEPEPFGVQGADRLPRDLQRDRDVTQPAAALRLRDDRALIANDGIVEPRLERVPSHRLKHPTGDEDYVHARGARALDCGTRSR